MTISYSAADAVTLGRDVLRHEAAELERAAGDLGEAFAEAVKLILGVKGRLVVSGVGKSGHIGRKLAATFASTGTPPSSSMRRKPPTATSA